MELKPKLAAAAVQYSTGCAKMNRWIIFKYSAAKQQISWVVSFWLFPNNVQLQRHLAIWNAIWQYFVSIRLHLTQGRSDSTVIERRQQQLGRMADFPPLVTLSVFDLQNHEAPQIKSQTKRHPLMNLINTTLSQKYGDPWLKVSNYGSVIKSDQPWHN